MPGFIVNGIGGNRGGQSPNQRFYTSYSWEILNLTNKLYLGRILTGRLLLKTATLPQATFQKITAEGGTLEYKFAGKPKFEDVRISWYDTRGFNRLYKDWYDLIYQDGTGVRPPSAYKGDAVMRKYLADRPDSEDSPVTEPAARSSGNTTYTLFGSWPTSFKESELTYLEASIKSVEVTITYDYFELVETNE